MRVRTRPTSIDGRAVGLGVYNAAQAYLGPLVDQPIDDLLAVVDVNCAGPLRFVRTLAPAMRERGRGGLVLMSSVAGLTGSPRLAGYAASKAFTVALGEGLWAELRPDGVDVVVSCPGAIRTPGYLAASASAREAAGTLDPAEVVEQTLDALGRGPVVVPGAVNKVGAVALRRALPRRLAIATMGRTVLSLT